MEDGLEVESREESKIQIVFLQNFVFWIDELSMGDQVRSDK